MSRNWKGLLGMALGCGFLMVGMPAWAVPTVAQPGALNYVEGQARIGDRIVTSKSVGSTVLNSGEVLSTGNSRVEFLLTPGIFMRVGKNSAVRMDSPELTNTRVEVLRGEAMVEADVVHKEDRVQIAERGALTQLEKRGIYAFDAERPAIRVYDGKAQLTKDDVQVDVKKGREVSLNQPLKAEKFDRDEAAATDPLYSWSKLRSQYLAEATAATAQTYVVNSGGWYGPGWYWNPFWGMYSFVPADGFFYNPFGWGLYSPVYVYRAPVIYPRFYRGVPGRVYTGPGAVTPRVQAPAIRSAPTVRSTPMMHSAPAMHAGGGMMRGGAMMGRRR